MVHASNIGNLLKHGRNRKIPVHRFPCCQGTVLLFFRTISFQKHPFQVPCFGTLAEDQNSLVTLSFKAKLQCGVFGGCKGQATCTTSLSLLLGFHLGPCTVVGEISNVGLLARGVEMLVLVRQIRGPQPSVGHLIKLVQWHKEHIQNS